MFDFKSPIRRQLLATFFLLALTMAAKAQDERGPCETGGQGCEKCQAQWADDENKVKFYCGSPDGGPQLPDELSSKSLSQLVQIALGNEAGEHECRKFRQRLSNVGSGARTESRAELAFTEAFKTCNSAELNIFGPSITVDEDGYPTIAAAKGALAVANDVSGATSAIKARIESLDLCVANSEGQISVPVLENQWKAVQAEAERAVACNRWFEFVAICVMDIPNNAISPNAKEPVYPTARQKQVEIMRAYLSWVAWWANKSTGFERNFAEIATLQDRVKRLRIVAMCQ